MGAGSCGVVANSRQKYFIEKKRQTGDSDDRTAYPQALGRQRRVLQGTIDQPVIGTQVCVLEGGSRGAPVGRQGLTQCGAADLSKPWLGRQRGGGYAGVGEQPHHPGATHVDLALVSTGGGLRPEHRHAEVGAGRRTNTLRQQPGGEQPTA